MFSAKFTWTFSLHCHEVLRKQRTTPNILLAIACSARKKVIITYKIQHFNQQILSYEY